MGTKKFILVLLFISFMILPVYASAAKGVSAVDNKLCLACHSDKTLNKKLMNKEILSLYVNGGEFASSVHARVSCSGCHPDIAMDNHPQSKSIRSRKDFTLGVSRNCSNCHTAAELDKRQPIHRALAAKGPCIECHGSHYIKAVAIGKVGVKENTYCLTCHKNKINMSMKNGEALSVYVDEAALAGSAHAKLQCTQCHSEFSKTQHPVRSFGSRRAYSIAAAELCLTCHKEAAKLYGAGIHFEQLKAGNVKAPACTDCHGDHAIASVKKDKEIGVVSCNKCHSDMNASYEASMHGKARTKGDEKAPSCASCHNAHDVESAKMTTKIKDGCMKCHKDAAKVHSKWLYNPPVKLSSFAKAHFDGVSCAACHSPGAERAIYLSLYDRMTGKPLTEEDILKNLGGSATEGLMARIDENANGSIDPKEMWGLFAQLIKKGVIATFTGNMDVQKATEAHMIGSKAEGVKDCDKCHKPDAELFQNVFVVVKKADGKPTVLKADKGVLNSIYTILPVSKFYVLGSSSVKLLDVLFIVALLGGIAVPIGHLLFRLITSPLRALRRMGKGGKK
jgi:predicted CXXCH cytochrome family protein